MTWQAPQLEHLVDDRLRRLRLELLEDPKIVDDDAPAASPAKHLIRHIEERFAAEARAGFDAVESSLRLDATERLLDDGHPAGQVNAALKKAARHFASPPRPDRLNIEEPAVTPGLAAGLVFAAWTVGVLMVWVATGFPGFVLAVAMAAGLLPAWAVHKAWRKREMALKSEIIHEYPVRICRHYMHRLRASVAAYEKSVAQLESRPAPAPANGKGHTVETPPVYAGSESVAVTN